MLAPGVIQKTLLYPKHSASVGSSQILHTEFGEPVSCEHKLISVPVGCEFLSLSAQVQFVDRLVHVGVPDLVQKLGAIGIIQHSLVGNSIGIVSIQPLRGFALLRRSSIGKCGPSA